MVEHLLRQPHDGIDVFREFLLDHESKHGNEDLPQEGQVLASLILITGSTVSQDKFISGMNSLVAWNN
jgi:hypothetical protein